MRQAALRLALENPRVRSLLNPRQSTPVVYTDSPLNVPTQTELIMSSIAPEARLSELDAHLSSCLGSAFIVLCFGASPAHFDEKPLENKLPYSMRVLSTSCPVARRKYGVTALCPNRCVLIRPDSYLMGAWGKVDEAEINRTLQRAFQSALRRVAQGF